MIHIYAWKHLGDLKVSSGPSFSKYIQNSLSKLLSHIGIAMFIISILTSCSTTN